MRTTLFSIALASVLAFTSGEAAMARPGHGGGHSSGHASHFSGSHASHAGGSHVRSYGGLATMATDITGIGATHTTMGLDRCWAAGSFMGRQTMTSRPATTMKRLRSMARLHPRVSRNL